MRFGILSQYYPPEMGAPQARLSELAKRFVARGHDVTVLTAMPNYPQGRIHAGYGGLLAREERDGVTVWRAPLYPTKNARIIPRLGSYLSFAASAAAVGAVALPPLDYLMTESPPLFLGITGYVLSRLKKARWIFNVSDLWPESAAQMSVVDRAGPFFRMAAALEAVCYRHAWMVTGQSREIVESVATRFPDVRAYRLSNGVDTALFRPDLPSDAVRQQFAKKGDVLAVYAGLHGIAQGLDQVLDAAVQLKDLPNLRIVLLGDGPEKEALVERSRAMGLANVEFFPPQPREAMPAILAAADIALVPLKYVLPGAVPSKLYEAMGAGVPVVLVAAGEPAQVVREAECGVVIAPGDTEQLAAGLRTLVQDANLRTVLGQRGRRVAETHFSRQTIADSFIDLLEQNAG